MKNVKFSIVSSNNANPRVVRNMRNIMTTINPNNIIEIKWDGPFSLEKFQTLNSNNDYGLYQIYGTYSIYGVNTLLYIGKAAEQKFAVRSFQHLSWLEREINELSFYIGRIGSSSENKLCSIKGSWTKHIDIAERLLIFFSAPAYNTSNLNGYYIDEAEDYIVLNLGKKMFLPFEISTLYNKTIFWKNEWKTLEE